MNKSGKIKMYKKEGSEERKKRSLENLEIKSHLSTPISHISGITLVALVVTILFSYDEKLKCSNSKGFLLQTI